MDTPLHPQQITGKPAHGLQGHLQALFLLTAWSKMLSHMATRSPSGLVTAVTIASNNSEKLATSPNTTRFRFSLPAQIPVESYDTIFPEMGQSMAGLR